MANSSLQFIKTRKPFSYNVEKGLLTLRILNMPRGYLGPAE